MCVCLDVLHRIDYHPVHRMFDDGGMPTRSRKTFWVIFAVLIVAAIPRALSIGWNQPYWHDNELYGNAAESLATRGDFKIGTVKVTSDDLHYSVTKAGGEYLSHNPFWPTLGGALSIVTGLGGFDALAMLSFAFGIGVLILMMSLARQIAGEQAGWVALILSAGSFILIDYSGNGSYYIFQAFTYLLFLWCIWKGGRAAHPITLGLLAAVAVLTVHQSVALVPAYFIYLLLEKRTWRKRLGSAAIFLGIIVTLYLPWGLRNASLLNDFFPPTDTNYVWGKLGVPKTVDAEGIATFAVNDGTYVELAKRELTTWIPNNTYFVNRQLFILVPLLYVLALFATFEILWDRGRTREGPRASHRLLPLLTLLAGHAFISIIWPVVKFRYFTAMVPLVILLGLWFAYAYLKRSRNAVIAISLALMGVLSLLTYLGSPAHTYFYGGVLTTDPFSRKWEVDFVKSYVPEYRDPNL